MASGRIHPALRLSADELFLSWTRQRQAAKRRSDRVSAASIARYAPIWSLWQRHLAQAEVRWSAASAEHLASFVLSRTPRTERHTKASTVTQTRYWRLVQAVYGALPGVCALRGWPSLAHPLASAEAPRDARSEAAASTVLTEDAWRCLERDLDSPLPCRDLQDVRHAWVHVRNRALLGLLLATGATVAETAALGVHQLFGDAEGAGLAGPTSDGVAPGWRVQLQGRQLHTLRTLPLPGASGRWMGAWVTERATLGVRHDRVFVGAKGLVGLSHVALWRCAAEGVRSGLLRHGQEVPYQLGPNLLRNTVILRWLRAGLPAHEVARRAGLKTVRALERLVLLCDPDTIDAWRAAMRSAGEDDIARVRAEADHGG